MTTKTATITTTTITTITTTITTKTLVERRETIICSIASIASHQSDLLYIVLIMIVEIQRYAKTAWSLSINVGSDYKTIYDTDSIMFYLKIQLIGCVGYLRRSRESRHLRSS